MQYSSGSSRRLCAQNNNKVSIWFESEILFTNIIGATDVDKYVSWEL